MMGRNDDISRLSEITGISDATFLMALLDEAGSVEAASEVYASNLQELADLDAKKTPIRAAGASSHATKPPGVPLPTSSPVTAPINEALAAHLATPLNCDMLHKAKSVQAPTITRKHAQAAQKILSKIPFHGDRDAFTNLITISRDQLPEDAGEATLFLKNICQDMRISSSSFFDLGVINLSLDPSLSRMEDFELKQHVQALKFCFFIDSLPAAVCIFDSKSILLGVASATNKHQQDFLVALAEARAFVDIQSSLTLFNNAVAMTFDSSLGQKAMTSLQAMTAKQAKTNGGSRQNQSLVSKESVITLKSSLRLTALKTNGTAGIPHSTWGPFERLMHAAIEMPSGLTIGPDSDGLLNFCDKGRMRMDVPISRASSSSSSSPPADQKGVELPTSLTDFPSLMSSISIVADDFAMRSAKAPKGVKSKPHPFQLQGLQWMLDRERKEDACNRGVVSLHPAWTQLISADGKEVLYVNRSERKVSRYFTPAPIQTTCGGMVCDEMGLGKTLMTLMLIASNPCPSDWPTTGKGEQAVQHWATEEAASGKKQALQSSLCLCAVPTTLIIAPANLLQQWAAEVRKHFNGPEVLSCGIYTDKVSSSEEATRRKCEPLDSILCKNVWPEGPALVPMQDLDVVLMSYEGLQKQLKPKHGLRDSILLRYGWWRICLDEAQNVARTNSTAAQLASDLARRYAWVISGTPVTTDLDELRGLSTFLSLQPYMKPATWKSLLETPLKVKSQAGLLSAWSMLRGVMLRRTKRQVEDQICLPPCVWEDRAVTLGPLERHIYSEQIGFLMSKLSSFGLSPSVLRSFKSSLSELKLEKSAKVDIRTLFTNLRQSCLHPQLVKSRDDLYGSQRLTLGEILDQIVKKSYRDYDEEARQLYALKLKSFMDELAQTERKSSHARSFLLRMIEEIELITTLVSCPAMEDAQASCWGPGGHFDADAASSLIIPPSGSKRLNH